MVLCNSIISQTVRRFLILITKKCRIYAAYGVSQTPRMINKGEVIVDNLSKSTENVEAKLKTSGVDVVLRSSVYRSDDLSDIVLNTVNESIDIRGLNIVIYDPEKNAVIDRVCFDTHTKANVCYRKEKKLERQQEINARNINHLKKHIEQLTKKVDKLKEKAEIESKKIQTMLWHTMDSSAQCKTNGIIDAKKNFFLSLPPATGLLRDIQLAGKVLLEKFDNVCRTHGLKYWLSAGTLLGALRHKGFIPWDDDTDVFMMREDLYKLHKIMKNDPDFYCFEFFTARNVKPGKCNRNHQLHFIEKDTPYCLDIFVVDYADSTGESLINNMHNLKEKLNTESLTLVKKYNPKQERGLYQSEEFRLLFEKYISLSFEYLGDQVNGKYLAWAIDNVELSMYKKLYQPATDVFPLTEIEFEGHMYMAPNDPERYLNNFYGDIWKLPDDLYSPKHFIERMDNERIKVLRKILQKHSIS